jgi:hypothetical protein
MFFRSKDVRPATLDEFDAVVDRVFTAFWPHIRKSY